MKSNLKQLGLVLSLIGLLVLSSCKTKKPIIYSEVNYKKLPDVETSYYKSPQERKQQDENIALGVSISGGGSRAQYFGLGVLIGLDEIKKESNTFLNEIDYFSTVSGGGFAAGYYLALKENSVFEDKSFLTFWKSNDRKDTLQENLFKAAKASSIIKLWGYERNLIFTPYPTMIAEQLLQQDKAYKNKRVKKLSLGNFFIPVNSTKQVTLPMFVTNGTIYNNGERIPFMPHILNYLKINGSLLPEVEFDSSSGYDFPLSYAIAGSAAFPGVLPMLKLTIEENEKEVIRIIDGGAVENLGYKTLFELLNSDNSKTLKKRALIVNCAGLGIEEQWSDSETVGIPKLLTKALMYSVDINLLNSEKSIPIEANRDDIKYEKIGFYTLKNEFQKMQSNSENSNLQTELNTIRSKIKNTKKSWEKVYRGFAKRNVFRDFNKVGIVDNFDNISDIPTSRFSEFGMLEVFELFELAADVVTKIKIYPWEKQVLILAGRYAVYLKSEDIVKLLD